MELGVSHELLNNLWTRLYLRAIIKLKYEQRKPMRSFKTHSYAMLSWKQPSWTQDKEDGWPHKITHAQLKMQYSIVMLPYQRFSCKFRGFLYFLNHEDVDYAAKMHKVIKHCNAVLLIQPGNCIYSAVLNLYNNVQSSIETLQNCAEQDEKWTIPFTM